MPLTDVVFEQNLTYSAEQTRRAIYALLKRGATIGSAVGGLVSATDFQTTYGGSGLGVSVSAGEVFCPGSSTTTQSAYYLRAASATSLTPAAANPSNPRIDLIYDQVNDATYSGSTNNATCSIATGTPTSGATLGNLTGAPTLPTSSYALAYVLIPAGATTISNVDIANVGTVASISLVASGFTGRYTRRVVPVTQAATPAMDTDNMDIAVITGLAQAITSMTTNLTGTPNDGDTLMLRFTDNGTARAITFGAKFVATTVALPTTTVISTTLRVGFMWNAAVSAWECLGSA